MSITRNKKLGMNRTKKRGYKREKSSSGTEQTMSSQEHPDFYIIDSIY